MAFVWDNDTQRVMLPDKEWVEVKRFTQLDFKRVERAALNSMKAPSLSMARDENGQMTLEDGAKLDIEIPMDAFIEVEFAALDIGIVAWSFLYPGSHPQAGQPVEVNRENIRRLDRETFNAIKEAINGVNSPRTGETKNA